VDVRRGAEAGPGDSARSCGVAPGVRPGDVSGPDQVSGRDLSVKHDKTGVDRGSLAVGPGAGRDLDTRNIREHPRRTSSLRVTGSGPFYKGINSLKNLQRKKLRPAR
jgi:hypothetical protein